MMGTLFYMTRRNVKVFLKDRMAVFFSLLTPLIVLGLYLLFLGRLQIDAVTESVAAAGATVSSGQIKAFCDSWMLTGLMSTACITVALSGAGLVVHDKISGVNADIAAAPVRKWVPTASYFLSTYIEALIICLLVLIVTFVYLLAGGMWFLSFTDVLGLIGTTALSALSASMLMLIAVAFIKSESVFSSVNIIVGTAIGFLIGAYMPISMFPKAIQYLTLFLPGSYSAGLFRHFFMSGALSEMSGALPAEMIDSLSRTYSMNYDFFGLTIGPGAMAIILAASVIVFAGINLLISYLRQKRAR